MIRTALYLAVVVCAAAFLGCRRDSQPPPRAVSSDVGPLAPVIVNYRVDDRSIIASAPPLPEPGSEATAPPADNPPPAGNVDRSPEAPAAEPPAESNSDAAAERPAAEPVPEPPPKPADNTTARPAPRPNRGTDELDGVYTGPGMLRNR